MAYDFTIEDIRAAADNDLAAMNLVIRCVERRVSRLATDLATVNHRVDYALADDLTQVGNIAIWQSIGKFTGHTVGEFVRFFERTAHRDMSAARRAETAHGASADAMKRWENALRLAGGDADAAQRNVTNAETAGGPSRVLTAELARDCRMAALPRISMEDLAYDLPENPQEAAGEVRTLEVARVRTVLGGLTPSERGVLSADHGVGDFDPCASNAEIEQRYGIKSPSVFRSTGTKKFRTNFVSAFGHPYGDDV